VLPSTVGGDGARICAKGHRLGRRDLFGVDRSHRRARCVGAHRYRSACHIRSPSLTIRSAPARDGLEESRARTRALAAITTVRQNLLF
jgi:hypothetical protein